MARTMLMGPSQGYQDTQQPDRAAACLERKHANHVRIMGGNVILTGRSVNRPLLSSAPHDGELTSPGTSTRATSFRSRRS